MRSMSITRNIVMFAIVLIVLLINSIAGAVNSGQEKLYSEIAGDYELDIGGRILPFSITLKEGKLFFDAGLEGIEPEEMKPAEGEDLKFESIDPNGDEVMFTFKKGDERKITGCTVYLPSRGVEAEAVKKD